MNLSSKFVITLKKSKQKKYVFGKNIHTMTYLTYLYLNALNQNTTSIQIHILTIQQKHMDLLFIIEQEIQLIRSQHLVL